MRDPKNRDNPMTVAELQKLAPAFDWSAYLTATGAPAFTRLNVTSRKYFAEGNAAVEATPARRTGRPTCGGTWCDAAAPYLGAAFVQEDFRFNRAYLQGAQGDRAALEALRAGHRPRARRRARPALRREDVRRRRQGAHEGDDRGHHRRAARGHRDPALDDARTRSRRRSPSSPPSARDKVGYPDKWKDYASVEVKRDDYFGNSRRARVFEIKRDQARIGKPTDRTLWGMTPPDRERLLQLGRTTRSCSRPASCSRRSSTASIDDAVNFGGIGVVIGHEYTHGFDDQGSKFDADGQPRELVDRRTTSRRFEERTDCIAKEYDGFVTRQGPGERRRAPERPAHPRREHRRQRRPARRLHGAAEDARRQGRARRSTASRPSSASSWASPTSGARTSPRQAARQLAQTDPHSPGEFRVIGSVSNMPEFAQAFGCKAGQPMVRENACRAW